MHSVRTAMKSHVEIESVRYWLDSQTALYWINNNNKLEHIVQHRMNEILRLSSECEWWHVSGLENPADLGSGYVSATILKENTLWREGPSWLKQERECWPKSLNLEDSERVMEE